MKVNIDVDKDIYEVEVHSSDLWSLDYTLSKIIHPAMIRFKEEEHGTAAIDKQDVPESLHDTYGTSDDLPDRFSDEAYRWVIDEIIWTFGEIAEEYPNEPKVFKSEAYKNYMNRKANGLRLFGKYFNSFWN